MHVHAWCMSACTRLLRICGAGPAPLPLEMSCSRMRLIPLTFLSISSSDRTGLSVLLPVTPPVT